MSQTTNTNRLRSGLDAAAVPMQAVLVDLIDLSLQGKQAHWNLKGAGFKAIHELLDEIVLAARMSSDEVAERIVTIGVPAEGRPSQVAETRGGTDIPGEFITVETAVASVADHLAGVVGRIRDQLPAVADADPVSEDLLIGIVASLEKQLWMLESFEG